MGAAAVLEEKYAKEIALIIDSAEPVMTVTLDMSDAIEIAIKEGVAPGKIVSIDGNVVKVVLGGEGGYSYSFFNDVDVVASFDSQNGGRYIFFITEK